MNDTVRQLTTVLLFSCYHNLEDAVKLLSSDANKNQTIELWTTQIKPDFLLSKQSALELCILYKKPHLLKYFLDLPPNFNNLQASNVIKGAIRTCTHTDQFHLIPALMEMIIVPIDKPIDVPLEEKNPSLGQNIDMNCIACTRNIKNVAFVPCGHTPFCVNCCRHYIITQRKSTCPNCRRQIKQVIKLYN